MRFVKLMLSLCIPVLALTLLLSWLPTLAINDHDGSKEVAIYQPAPVVRLTSSNLVDVFASVSWNEELKSVKWNGSILTVSFKVDGQKGRPSAWFADVERLLRTSFLQLENVKRVLIRIVDDQTPSGNLLLAIDVRKTDEWLYDNFEGLKDSDPIHDERWRSRLRISFASAWEQRFGAPPSYSARPTQR